MPRRRLPQDPIQDLLALIEGNGGRYPRPAYVPCWTEDLLGSGARYELPAPLFNLHTRLLMEQALTGWLPTDVSLLAARLGMAPADLELQLVHLDPWYTDLGDGRMLNPRMAGECALAIRKLANRSVVGRLGGEASARRRAAQAPDVAPDCTVGPTDGAPTAAPTGEPGGAPTGEPTQNPEPPTTVGGSLSPDTGGAKGPPPRRKAKGPHDDDLELAGQLADLIVRAGVRPTAKASSTSIAGFGRLRRRLIREGATAAAAADRIERCLAWVFLQSPDPATGYSHRRNLLSGDSWAAKVSKGDGYRFDRVEAEARRGATPSAPASKRQEDAEVSRADYARCASAFKALLAAAGGDAKARAAVEASAKAQAALAVLPGFQELLAAAGPDQVPDLAADWTRAWKLTLA